MSNSTPMERSKKEIYHLSIDRFVLSFLSTWNNRSNYFLEIANSSPCVSSIETFENREKITKTTNFMSGKVNDMLDWIDQWKFFSLFYVSVHRKNIIDQERNSYRYKGCFLPWNYFTFYHVLVTLVSIKWMKHLQAFILLLILSWLVISNRFDKHIIN